MDLPSDLASHLRDLVDSIGADDTLTESLEALAGHLRSAVPSYLGLRLTLVLDGWPVTMTAFSVVDGIRPATSLRLNLSSQGPGYDPQSLIVFYGGTAGAFVDLAADIDYLHRRDRAQTDGDGQHPAVTLDIDLPPGLSFRVHWFGRVRDDQPRCGTAHRTRPRPQPGPGHAAPRRGRQRLGPSSLCGSAPRHGLAVQTLMPGSLRTRAATRIREGSSACGAGSKRACQPTEPPGRPGFGAGRGRSGARRHRRWCLEQTISPSDSTDEEVMRTSPETLVHRSPMSSTGSPGQS